MIFIFYRFGLLDPLTFSMLDCDRRFLLMFDDFSRFGKLVLLRMTGWSSCIACDFFGLPITIMSSMDVALCCSYVSAKRTLDDSASRSDDR